MPGEDEHASAAELVADAGPGRVVLVAGPAAAGAAILRTDRLYDAGGSGGPCARAETPRSAVDLAARPARGRCWRPTTS